MTDTTVTRPIDRDALIPAQGSYGCAANILLLQGTIVTIDADGRADVPTAGQNAVGIADNPYDNRTAASGGAADAVTAEVSFGVYGLDYTGTAPTPGQVVYVVDNQTVSTDSDSGTRGIAGYCIVVKYGQAYVWMGPHVVGQIVIAAAVAADVATAQADIAALEADVVSTDNQFDIPLGVFRASDGTAIGAFADNTTDGFTLYGSEALGIRWNDSGSTRLTIAANFSLPSDVNPSGDLVFELEGCRVGSTDATMVLTTGVYFHPAGVAPDADADAGGSSTAFDGATTIVTTETLTVDSADVPAASVAGTITIVPDAALDGDDFVLTAVRCKYTGIALT